MSITIKDQKISFTDLKYIIEKLFNIDFYKYISGEVSLDMSQKALLDNVVRDYAQGKPLEYILKQSNFFGLNLDINESVLIPRPETEILVETIIKYIKVKKSPFILDIGTGSGNITVALSRRLKSAKILSSDISLEAVRVAKRNVSKYKCDNVLIIGADLLSSFKGNCFDIIVSNPPYVESSYIDDKTSLGFEPRIALDGGEDGLIFIRRILKEVSDYLKKDGLLFLEIGYNQKEKILDYAKDKGLNLVEVVSDYAGIERILVFVRNN